MNIIERVNERMKTSVRKWLNVPDNPPYTISINEVNDFENSAIRSRIWYRGDSNELAQLYSEVVEYADRYKFWAAKTSPGMEIRKIHTGLPSLIVNTLAGIIVSDLNAFEFTDSTGKDARNAEIWEHIEKENKLTANLKEYIQDVLVAGDGAFKITIDKEISEYPIIEWYSGETVEYSYRYGRLSEVIFRTEVREGKKDFTLLEHYGYGYIVSELFDGDRNVEMGPELAQKYPNVVFDKSLIMAVPVKFFPSSKWKGRGRCVYDAKIDNFDAFDEIWSQWMDAIRAGRAAKYIPENLIPRDPETGALMRPNPFDNRFITIKGSFSETGSNDIEVKQPVIPHDSYTAAYITALDLCLQGIMSPSTLGIDTKKLDNAEAQREKEKTTLYTRNAIVDALQEALPELAVNCLNAYNVLNMKKPETINCTVTFGEYANPSFESQIETVAKGKQGGIMSIEAAVDELYGDTKEEAWKKEEVERLKQEQGIAELTEPALNLDGVEIEDSTDEEPEETEEQDTADGSGNPEEPSEPAETAGNTAEAG